MLGQTRGQREITQRGSQAYLGETNSNVKDSKALGTLASRGIWEHMLATNPIALIGYQSMVATLQSADWRVENPKKASKKVEKYVNLLFFERLRQNLKQLVGTVLRAPGYGVAPHEVTAYEYGGLWWLNMAEYRPIRTFQQSSIYIDRDGYVNARQEFYGGPQGRLERVDYGRGDGKSLLWWVKYGDGMFGMPILRAIYTEHATKEDVRRILAIAVQKNLLPPPAVYLDGDEPDQDSPESAAYTEMLDEIADVIYTENGVVGIPGSVAKIEPLNVTAAEGLAKAIMVMNHLDIQILMAFGAHWMARGLMAQFGSNAAAKVDVSEQRNIRQHFLDWMTDCFDWLIHLFVDYNFGPQLAYPELRATYRPEIEIKEEADITAKLISQGVMSVSDADEDYWRNELRQPKRQVESSEQSRSGVGTALPETPGTYTPTDDTRERQSEGDYT